MNIEDIYMKRVENGMKLVAGLFTLQSVPPYARSVLEAARYGKMRILEALVSNSEHDESPEGSRSSLINEIDNLTGRSALHFLSYAGETDMIQVLAATDLLKINMLDARDRTCMHYAAIKGDSSLINCLFMLYKQLGSKTMIRSGSLKAMLARDTDPVLARQREQMRQWKLVKPFGEPVFEGGEAEDDIEDEVEEDYGDFDGESVGDEDAGDGDQAQESVRFELEPDEPEPAKEEVDKNAATDKSGAPPM